MTTAEVPAASSGMARMKLLEMAKPLMGSSPEGSAGFDFEILVMHKEIADDLKARTWREKRIEILLGMFCTFFRRHHVDLAEALIHAEAWFDREEQERMQKLPWVGLLNHLHMDVSDAYQCFAWGFGLNEMRESDVGSACVGTPVWIAQAILRLVFWAEYAGFGHELLVGD